jgi:hypothetical protein
MHTSITIHLVNEWLLDEGNGVWGPNLEEFERRLGGPEHKDRVQNLYFAYLFVLRAVLKAAPLLSSYDYATGLPKEDLMTNKMMKQLVSVARVLVWLMHEGSVDLELKDSSGIHTLASCPCPLRKPLADAQKCV